MSKFIIMAEEGERSLLDKACVQTGLDLGDAQVIFTGVGAINVIRALQHLDREAKCITSAMRVARISISARGWR